MSINLLKGQKIDLTKGNDTLSNLLVGLGWDPIQKPSTGFLSSLFSTTHEIDCDAAVFMLNTNGVIPNPESVVYFGNLRSSCGSIVHTGDNLTGDGDGDDEQLLVSLNKIPQSIHRLVFVVNIYESRKRNQHFGMIENAYIRISDSKTGKELMKFNLSDNFNNLTSLIAGEIYRYNNEWKFSAIGEGTSDSSLGELSNRYL